MKRRSPGFRLVSLLTRRRPLQSCCILTMFLASLCFLGMKTIPRDPSSWKKNTGVEDAILSDQEDNSTTYLPLPQALSRAAASIVDSDSYPAIPALSLTVIVPCTLHVISQLPSLFRLSPLSYIRQIIIPCPASLVGQTTVAARRLRVNFRAEISVQRLSGDSFDETAYGHAISIVTTPWCLVLADDLLFDLNALDVDALLYPTEFPFPTGPRGLRWSLERSACVRTNDFTRQAAAFLVPPFVSPTHLLQASLTGLSLDSNATFWAALGHRIVSIDGQGYGGRVLSRSGNQWCSRTQQALSSSPMKRTFVESFYQALQMPVALHGVISLVLPTTKHLHEFANTACRLAQKYHLIQILLYSTTPDDQIEHGIWLQTTKCGLRVETLSARRSVQTWIKDLNNATDIMILVSERDSTTFAFEASFHRFLPPNITRIHIPEMDLSFCEWMGTLSVDELKHWHVPRIDLSVITNNRPWSLTRLLASLNGARYFGDRPHLIINMEQTADPETRDVVDRYSWSHGETTLRHRIVLGGLMASVVESWYPINNHSYGILLEDDIELAPLFYAWAKFSILRYRYGDPDNQRKSLFGISLYQQKTVELRPEGRRPFSAQAVLKSQGFSHPRSPYLSQIPCSWGAALFPEHWREFHDYLTLRLSEKTHSLEDLVVPDVRSNRWTRSWKKYFIEMVYLRGYVMLYPNYDDFVSLSTNHLEVGSHVKDLPKDIHGKKKLQFTVPLMKLPDSNQPTLVDLLDLPNSALPNWRDLPVFDLFGSLSSELDIARLAVERRMEISHCSDCTVSTYDARELLCPA